MPLGSTSLSLCSLAVLMQLEATSSQKCSKAISCESELNLEHLECKSESCVKTLRCERELSIKSLGFELSVESRECESEPNLGQNPELSL